MTARIMPRPAKHITQRRTQRVEVRLTSFEEKSLQELAEEAGLSLSDFIRREALGSKPRLQKADPDRAIFIKSLAELGKIGSNVNQLAKAINTDLAKGVKASVPGDAITAAMASVQSLSAHLINTLANGDTR
jgi:transposase